MNIGGKYIQNVTVPSGGNPSRLFDKERHGRGFIKQP